jgi:hypothetical protein
MTKISWRKSSYTTSNGGNCVETAALGPQIGVRDSKDPDGPRLAFTPQAWQTFATKLKAKS